MRIARLFRATGIYLACLSLLACASAPGQETGPRSAPLPPIGWLHDSCMALADADVEPGTGIVLVTLERPQQIISARVGPRAAPDEGCTALLEDRRAVNAASGMTFYTVLPKLEGLAIGVLVNEPAGSPTDQLDVDRDGARDVFGHCATSEGVRFFIHPGDAGKHEPLWTGQYHLGYEVEADCADSM